MENFVLEENGRTVTVAVSPRSRDMLMTVNADRLTHAIPPRHPLLLNMNIVCLLIVTLIVAIICSIFFRNQKEVGERVEPMDVDEWPDAKQMYPGYYPGAFDDIFTLCCKALFAISSIFFYNQKEVEQKVEPMEVDELPDTKQMSPVYDPVVYDYNGVPQYWTDYYNSDIFAVPQQQNKLQKDSELSKIFVLTTRKDSPIQFIVI